MTRVHIFLVYTKKLLSAYKYLKIYGHEKYFQDWVKWLFNDEHSWILKSDSIVPPPILDCF